MHFDSMCLFLRPNLTHSRRQHVLKTHYTLKLSVQGTAMEEIKDTTGAKTIPGPQDWDLMAGQEVKAVLSLFFYLRAILNDKRINH